MSTEKCFFNPANPHHGKHWEDRATPGQAKTILNMCTAMDWSTGLTMSGSRTRNVLTDHLGNIWRAPESIQEAFTKHEASQLIQYMKRKKDALAADYISQIIYLKKKAQSAT